MNTQAQQKLKIKAGHIGPVFDLDSELSCKDHNLVFAKNGVGKSFLSRAFRYLDLAGQGKNIDDAAVDLVSEEFCGGSIEISQGQGNILGSLDLNKETKKATPSSNTTIFHVFSEDFVEHQLRQKKYKPDDTINHEIIIGEENIELEQKKKERQEKVGEQNKALEELEKEFDTKREEFRKEAGIDKRLKAYKDIRLPITDMPEDANLFSLTKIISQLDRLKQIPTERDDPALIKEISHETIERDSIQEDLIRVTSQAIIEKKFRDKIDADPDFIKKGLAQIEEKELRECPFCDQDITNNTAQAVIDIYSKFFQDEEAKHKERLQGYKKNLKDLEKKISEKLLFASKQENKFDSLKQSIPSQKDERLPNLAQSAERVIHFLNELISKIDEKHESLNAHITMPVGDLNKFLRDLNGGIGLFDKMINQLLKILADITDERKKLQNTACQAFKRAFYKDNREPIKKIKDLDSETQTLEDAIKALEESGVSKSAKDRVVGTLQTMLREFFGDKYSFDKATFSLQHEKKDMKRGNHKTFSDGEKSVIAFCYFIALCHAKVKKDKDYKNLFLVLDDPVTSMSFDYVCHIVQTLKDIKISDKGEISIRSGNSNSGENKPRMLIFTHSGFFFNVALKNRLVKKDSSFSLLKNQNGHEIKSLKKFVAPFEAQLHDVLSVRDGAEASHTTANSVRFVIEAMGRFCYPKMSLTDFIEEIGKDDSLRIRSTLINHFSHGTYDDSCPDPDDLKLACEEAVNVVKKYAPGQIE